MASKSIDNPAGTPSTIATSVWPCDSPAVRNRSIRRTFYPKKLRRPADDPRVHARASEAAILHSRRVTDGSGLELLMDRLAVNDAAHALDLATCDPIVLTIRSAGGPA